MSADQIADTRPSIVEVFKASSDGEDWCVQFTLSDRAEGPWVQVTRDMVNFAYPHDRNPDDLLSTLEPPPSARVVAWESNVYATIKFGPNVTPSEVAKLVDAVFRHVLGCIGVDYHVDTKLERLS